MARKTRSDVGKKREKEYVHSAAFLEKQKNAGKIAPKKEQEKSAKIKATKKGAKKTKPETPKTEQPADVSTL